MVAHGPSPAFVLDCASRSPEALRIAVRARVGGQRALFLGAHAGADLPDELHAQLGLEVILGTGKPRGLEAACAQIAGGRYKLVLMAGHHHQVAEVARRAARRARIPFLRVGRGRPGACLQAIARELGLAGGH